MGALAGDLGHIDLTHYQLGDGKGSPSARTDMGTDGPPDEVLPEFLYLSGRRNCAEMDSMPFPQFTHVVFALNDAPLATPYACDTSYFVDVADMLEAPLPSNPRPTALSP